MGARLDACGEAVNLRMPLRALGCIRLFPRRRARLVTSMRSTTTSSGLAIHEAARRVWGRVGRFWPYGLLFALVWCAHFWMSASFGLYEDDFTLIPSSMVASPVGILRAVGEQLIGLKGHARPLQGASVLLLSYTGWHFDGLVGIYVVGFLLTGANALLFYGLLRRIGGDLFATLGSIAYVLYPADTTHPYLSHALGLQPSLTILHSRLPCLSIEGQSGILRLDRA